MSPWIGEHCSSAKPSPTLHVFRDDLESIMDRRRIYKLGITQFSQRGTLRMVSISHETPEETALRLAAVIAQAELRVLDGVWTFVEAPLGTQTPPLTDVLAIVRDEDTWSALAPVAAASKVGERFGVFSFHFPAGLDNSGFVGWLAGELKARLGTGVFVICGSNTQRGGIYDYWGCPVELLQQATQIVQELSDPQLPSHAADRR